METIKREEIKQHIIEQWNLFKYKQELAANIKIKYVDGTYATQEHYNIDEIWEIVQEVENEKNPPLVQEEQPFVPQPPTDTEVLNKLIEEGVVTQEVVDTIVDELTPEPSVVEEPIVEPIIPE